MSWTADVETKKYIHAMRFLSKEALPATVAETLNSTADAVAGQSKKNVQKRLIVRTKFTLNSIRQDRHARGNDIDRMFSRAGTISKYLPIQEEGGTVRADNRRIPIPTVQARRSRSLQKPISKPYRMNVLNIGGGRFFIGNPKGGNRPLGIWERYQNKKRLRLIRNLESSQVQIRGENWFSDAVKKYGTAQFIRAQFLKIAKRRLSEYGK